LIQISSKKCHEQNNAADREKQWPNLKQKHLELESYEAKLKLKAKDFKDKELPIKEEKLQEV
jgi:hypothetical protein